MMIDIYYIMLYRFIVVYKPTSNWGAPPCGGMTGMPGFGSLFLIGTDISDGGNQAWMALSCSCGVVSGGKCC